MSLELAHPDVPLDLNILVPSAPLSFLVVTLYFAADISLTPVKSPVIFNSPQKFQSCINNMHPSCQIDLSPYSKYKAPSVSRNSKLSLTVQVFGKKLRLSTTESEASHNLLHRDKWRWRFRFQEAPEDEWWESFESSSSFLAHPQYVILLLNFDPNTFGYETDNMPKHYSFFEGFFTAAKPVIFVLYYNPNGTHLMSSKVTSESAPLIATSAASAAVRSNFVGYMVNWFCRFQLPVKILNFHDRSLQATHYSVWWFTCLSVPGQNCWPYLIQAMDEACDRGRLTIWSHTDSAISNLKLDLAVETPLQPAWKQKETARVAIQLLFPLVNASDGHRLRLSKANVFRTYLYFEKTVTRTHDSIVFVTTEQVFSPTSGHQTYVEIFHLSTWIALLVTMSGCAVALTLPPQKKANSSSPLTFAGNIFKASTNLAASLIDQFGFQARNARILYGTWFLGILMLNNWFKAEVQSSFAFNYPHETKLENWRDFENFSLFGIRDPHHSKCQRTLYSERTLSEFEDLLSYKPDSMDDGYFTQWSLHTFGTISHYPPVSTLNYKTKQYDNIYDNTRYASAVTWFSKQIGNASDCIKATNSEKCRKDYQVLKTMFQGLDYICVDELNEYVDEQYQQKLREPHQTKKLPVPQWNLTADEYDPDELSSESKYLLYWMSRKNESAFVFSASRFPYYWNLFKQLMNSTKLRFAHTQINIPKDEFGVYIPQLSLLPEVEFGGPAHSYPPPAKWMLDRMKALTTSGLIRWYQKWDLILWPPRNYSRVEEVPERTVGAKPISLADPAFVTVLTLLVVGLAISLAVASVEHVSDLL